jgi:hypothetical protein
MRKLGLLFLLVIFSCTLLISCGEEEEEEPTNGGDTVAEPITLDKIAGTYNLVSFYDKDEDSTLVIGSEEAGDLEHTRVINADNTYSITETESGETYTESGTFSISSDNLIIFEIKESSDPESVKVKNTYAIKTEALPAQLVLVMQDSTDELFKEDVGDILTYEKKD